MRRFVAVLAAAAMLSGAACTDSNSVTNPTVDIAGTWSLRTLNGSSLPYNLGNRSIISEQLSLNNDGTYSDVATYSDGNFFNEVGYYTVNNNVITFQDQTDQIQYTGSISGSVLTEIDNVSGFTSVYQKQ